MSMNDAMRDKLERIIDLSTAISACRNDMRNMPTDAAVDMGYVDGNADMMAELESLVTQAALEHSGQGEPAKEYITQCEYGSSYPCNPGCDDAGYCYTKVTEKLPAPVSSVPDDYEEIGKRIYKQALRHRRGFREDQIGIDDDIWPEIYVDIGKAALEHVGQGNPEPVLYCNEGQILAAKKCREKGWDKGMVVFPFPNEAFNPVPLYTRPPVPAVPDEMGGGDALALFEINGDGQEAFADGWNACRDAMIKQWGQ